MAELNIFHYLPGNSVIHRLDPRIKMVSMLMMSITTGLINGIKDYLILTILLLLIFRLSKIPILRLLQELKYFFVFILTIIGIQALSLPKTAVSFIPLPQFTSDGLISGTFLGWRLIFVIIFCIIFTGTTQPSSLRRATEWFLHFIPRLPAARIGNMISLIFVLIPLIFDRATEISDAQTARCITGRKNPVQRIYWMVFPLLLRTFEQADEIAMAMESRCYTEVYRKPEFHVNTYDWLAFGLTGLVCCSVIWL